LPEGGTKPISLQSSFQQVLNAQFSSPLAQIGQVQAAGLHSGDANYVLPLILRDLPARPKPLPLCKDSVFCRCDIRGGAGFIEKRPRLPARKLLLAEAPLAKRKEVNFEGGFQMDKVERPTRLDGAANRGTIQIEFRRKGRCERLNLGHVERYDQVPIVGSSYESIEGTRRGPTHHVGDSQLLKLGYHPSEHIENVHWSSRWWEG